MPRTKTEKNKAPSQPKQPAYLLANERTNPCWGTATSNAEGEGKKGAYLGLKRGRNRVKRHKGEPVYLKELRGWWVLQKVNSSHIKPIKAQQTVPHRASSILKRWASESNLKRRQKEI